MSSKILFLDVDGVLNGHDFHDGARSNTIRRSCIDALSLILTETGCNVVLSSAWRYMLLCKAMKPHGFEYLLRTHGLCGIAGKVLGTTCADEDCTHCGARFRRRYGVFRRVNGKPRLKANFDNEGHFRCGVCEKSSTRGHQIGHWLTNHGPVLSYVVLDDEDYGITEAGHPLVKTDGTTGLTLDDARRAMEVLS